MFIVNIYEAIGALFTYRLWTNLQVHSQSTINKMQLFTIYLFL